VKLKDIESNTCSLSRPAAAEKNDPISIEKMRRMGRHRRRHREGIARGVPPAGRTGVRQLERIWQKAMLSLTRVEGI